MRVLILTQVRIGGYASRCLPLLCDNPNIDVAGVILAKSHTANKLRTFKWKLKKTLRIGLLGALNGLRMRKWYRPEGTEDIVSLSKHYGVPLINVAAINCDETRSIFREMNADLGLSLGNGYIAESVFSIPRYGMINIHTEVLPDFQGARSIIWPIYEGLNETGFTIHQIDRNIDTGDILLQERFPIKFHRSLGETVKKNLNVVRSHVPEAFCYVCENYEALRENAQKQEKQRGYMAPTIWEYFRMVRNHRKMRRMQRQ